MKKDIQYEGNRLAKNLPQRKKWMGASSSLGGLLIMGLIATPVLAGKIISVPTTESGANGFGGWNLDNVEVVVSGDGSSYNEETGNYFFSDDSDGTYFAEVYDQVFGVDAASPTGGLMGYVLAKDYPVGEPSGIKVINDDDSVKDPKPHNCIMATSYLADHFLDTLDPQQVTCSSGFQTHKRYKLAMLPGTVENPESEKGVDLVFNVETDGESRDYQVFQKINNWTDSRLKGFTIQVGFGIGENFKSTNEAEVALANLHLSVPQTIWTATQLANFSEGLFGPFDDHTETLGFFDPNQRAGFFIDEYIEDINTSPLQTDKLTATRTLGSDYAQIPHETGPASQFGPWVPSSMLPLGVFFDDDGNPETDAQLLAWYGWNPARVNENNELDPGLGWMSGSQGFDGDPETLGDAFEAISDEQIQTMGENLSYTMGEIDDLVNVGLNYIVTVDSISDFPTLDAGNIEDSLDDIATFTIRITPTKDDSGIDPPEYVGVHPEPSLQFTSSDAIVLLEPADTFVVGSLLTARVGDADENDTAEIDFLDVAISAHDADGGVVITEETLQLIEQGEDRGVFAATLPESFSNVAVGTVVTMTYIDLDTGEVDENNAPITETKFSTSTAVPEIAPILSDVSITDFTVPDALFDGLSRNLKVSILNSKDAEEVASGNVTVIGIVDDETKYTFTPAEFVDLKVNGKLKFSFRWTAALDDPAEAEDVTWSAIVTINETEVDIASGSTLVEVKKGKNSKK